MFPFRNPGLFHGERVGTEIIGHDNLDIFRNVIFDILRQRSALNILSMEEPEIAAALPDANHSFFPRSASSEASTFVLSADIGFIHLYRAIQHRFLRFFHRCADAMAEIPRGFVAHANGALDLIRAHALARFHQKHDSSEPAIQRQMGIVKDCARCYRELIITILAIEKFFRGIQRNDFVRLAARALRAIRPAQAHQQFAALFIGSKQILNINNCHRSLA